MERYTDAHTKQQLTDEDLDARFADSIDDVYGPIRFMDFSFWPSKVLKEMDPTGYRQEFHAWLDAEVKVGTITEERD